MNIKDFKSAYDGVRATPELKKRLMAKACEAKVKKGPRKGLHILGAAAGVAAAAALILGGAFFIRWLNMQAQPTIVVTAGSMPELTTAPPAAQPEADLREFSGESCDVNEMPQLDEKYTNEYSFGAAYDERYVTPPDEVENWLLWIMGSGLSAEEATELLKENGFSDEEAAAIVLQDKVLCDSLFAVYGYRCVINGEDKYLSAQRLYNYDVMSFYSLYSGGITAEDMDEVAQRMLEIAGEEDACNVAMKRKALLYRSYVMRMQRLAAGLDGSAESAWAVQYFDERVTCFDSEYEYGGVTVENLFAELFTDEQLSSISIPVGTCSKFIPSLYVIPNYYSAISRMDIPKEAVREALEKMSEEYRGKTGEELFTQEEIAIITGDSGYSFIERFIAPCAAISFGNISGEHLIVCAASIVDSGAYNWLIDYRDIDIEGVAQEIYERLSADGYDELAAYFGEQLDIYREICDITENRLDGYILANDISFIEESKPMLDDETRAALEKIDAEGVYGDYAANCADLYEMKLNYMLCFLPKEKTEELFSETCELLNSEQRNWFIKKKHFYLYYCSDDPSVLCNEEYLGALLDETNYEYELYNGTVYLEPYFSGITEYLNRFHIRHTAPAEESPKRKMQTLYEEKLSLYRDDYTITVEAPIGEISGEGYYNTEENTWLCVYGSDSEQITRAGSRNGMSGLDGLLVYAAPGEKYFDIYTAPNGEIIIILRTIYPERYRKEGEAYLFSDETGELKRFETSSDMPSGYNYSDGIFDYGDGGLEPCSDEQAAYINTADGLEIIFDFDSMMIKPADTA